MLVDVALPLPLFRTFTYSVPESDAAKARRGMRAVVPFRNRKEIGIIVSEGREQNGIIPKLVDSLPDSEPVVSPSILSLCEWIAEYYVVPLGVALRTALPGALASHVSPEPVRRTRRVAALHRELPSLMHRDRVFARAPQQRALFELIESLGGRSPVEHLLEQLSFSPSVLKGLVARNLVTVREEIVQRDPFAARPQISTRRHAPTVDQQQAISALAAGAPGEVFLLHGIT